MSLTTAKENLEKLLKSSVNKVSFFTILKKKTLYYLIYQIQTTLHIDQLYFKVDTSSFKEESKSKIHLSDDSVASQAFFNNSRDSLCFLFSKSFLVLRIKDLQEDLKPNYELNFRDQIISIKIHSSDNYYGVLSKNTFILYELGCPDLQYIVNLSCSFLNSFRNNHRLFLFERH